MIPLAVKNLIFHLPLSDKTLCLEAEQQLSEERDGYKACTVHPIWQLRDDLKHRICELRHDSLHQSQMENDFDPENIIQQVSILPLFPQQYLCVFLLSLCITTMIL